jgi:hypothetical protein
MIVQHVQEDDIGVSKRRHAYPARRFAKRRVLSRLNWVLVFREAAKS